MDRTKGPSLAAPAQETAKPAPAPKLRRKLQKVKRRGSGVPNEVSSNSSPSINKLDTVPKLSLPLPPDLSDSKWSEYLRSSGYLCATLDASPQPTDSLKPPVTIITELSHLTPSHETPRSSVETLGSGSTDASTASVRRRAKTPVHHIGELEARARLRKLEEANRRATAMKEAMEETCRNQSKTPEKTVAFIGTPQILNETDANTARATQGISLKETRVRAVTVADATSGPVDEMVVSARQVHARDISTSSSADLIAEEYKALITPTELMFTDCHTERPHSSYEGKEVLAVRRQRGSGDLRRDSREFEQAAAAESPQGSPTSDGTLVAFEEETIYFKPMSFSPEPSSPIHQHDETPMASPLPTPNNIGLKICVDLLARDLTSAVTRTDQAPPAEAAALQLWTMIEGYERLRERILDSRLRYDERLSLEQTFDTWLKALYTAHDRLLGVDHASVSEYGGLERAVGELELD